MSLYKTKGSIELFDISFRNRYIQIYALTPERVMPKRSSLHITIVLASISSKVFNPPAKTITGIDNKNENLADATLEKPKKSAAVIVIPEREVPGIKAIA